MLVNLSEIEKNQTLTRHLEVEAMEVEAVSGVVKAKDLKAEFKFRIDPQGYLMSYQLTGKACVPCTRCGQEVIQELNYSDLLALRKKRPEEHHLVLNHSEMNVYFWDQPTIDLMRVLEEIIELELPAYPRHKSGDPKCQVAEQEDPSEEKQSPFGALAKYLND